MSNTVSNSDDYIDVRDIIARYEELESEKEELKGAKLKADYSENNDAAWPRNIRNTKSYSLEKVLNLPA